MISLEIGNPNKNGILFKYSKQQKTARHIVRAVIISVVKIIS